MSNPASDNSNHCKIGAVSYLNTLPLVYGIERDQDPWSLSFDLPSRLADQLAASQLDIALIPSVEVFQNTQYTVVSDACIACRGPVWSVKLLSRVPIDEIKSLALDEGSRTSVALVQVLLAEQFQVRPQLVPLPINTDWQLAQTDAVLIIGDRAMQPERPKAFLHEVDLGQWWFELTGLPFVFAMWTARPGVDPRQLDRIGSLLSQSRDAGLANRKKIAELAAGQYGLTVAQVNDYFEKFLHFRLGPDERESLMRFRSLASELQLAPNHRELQFHDC